MCSGFVLDKCRIRQLLSEDSSSEIYWKYFLKMRYKNLEIANSSYPLS